MIIRNFRHSWPGLLALGLLPLGLLPAAAAQAKTVTLAMDVELDQVAPEDAKMYRVGGHDLDRITYDDTKVDPKTQRVRITSLSHYIGGQWHATEPADASILDMSSKPYRLNFVSSVNHGRLIVALFESDTMRMAMLARPDFHMLIAGKYVIDPTPLTAAQVAAPPPKAHDPDTMPMMSGMPMPGSPPGAAPPGAGPAAAPPAAAAPAGGGLTTASTYGALLANPKTKAVLVALASEVVNNPQSQMGLDLVFRDLAQYEPSLTPEKLAQIDARLKQAQ
jgi:hypothetical protein